MRTLRNVRITGTGMYVPPDVYSNKDLEKRMDTTDEWIQQRTGIKERRYAVDGVGASDLAVPAAEAALAAAGRTPKDLDMIIFATLSPDYYFPGSGVFLQEKLGCATIPALDVRNQCSGFLYGLNIAQTFIAAGQYERVLVVGAEAHSRALNFSTAGRDVAVLFGDGAGAVLVEASDAPEYGLLSIDLHSEGAYRDLLKIEYPSARRWPYLTQQAVDEGLHWPKMDGKTVFKHAVTRMPEAVHTALGKAGLTPADVDLFVFHQANMRINEAVMKQLGEPMGKAYNNIDKYGNCSAASIPMCIDECVRSGRLQPGNIVCTASFGAGFTWGAAVLRW